MMEGRRLALEADVRPPLDELVDPRQIALLVPGVPRPRADAAGGVEERHAERELLVPEGPPRFVGVWLLSPSKIEIQS